MSAHHHMQATASSCSYVKSLRSRAWGASADGAMVSGSSTVKVLPNASRLSIEMRPPCCSTTSREPARPKTRSGTRVGGIGRAPKRLEHVRKVRFRNADAMVLDAEHRPVLSVGLPASQRHTDLARSRAVLDNVAQEIAEHPFEASHVPPPDKLWHFANHLNLRRAGGRLLVGDLTLPSATRSTGSRRSASHWPAWSWARSSSSSSAAASTSGLANLPLPSQQKGQDSDGEKTCVVGCRGHTWGLL
jgi:hypothetical protein